MKPMKPRNRKIRRFVIEEDRFGDWTLILFYNKGKRQLITRAEDPSMILKGAANMPITQPETGWKWHD